MQPSEQLLELFRRIPLFAGLETSALAEVIAEGFRKTVQQGTFLFWQDEPARYMYVLLQGRVRLVKTTPEGQRVVIRYITPGEMFGVIAVLGQVTYPVTAEVAESGEVIGWSGDTMHALMECYPRIALNAMHQMAGRLRELLRRVQELSTERVERRIAHVLLRLTRQCGRKVEDGIQIDFSITREEIAQLAGTTLFTVSRTISKWEKQGILQTSREHMLIRQPHALVVIAEDLPPHPEENREDGE